ncbi:MAG TPA: 6-phospho-3-hexuloisomerase [Planctomycetota bacterium]|jgi:6-phospho-3-hexuloisomerase|nr:6-phospho-3-hexuloisomerase [Planctomycetota bacterium]
MTRQEPGGGGRKKTRAVYKLKHRAMGAPLSQHVGTVLEEIRDCFADFNFDSSEALAELILDAPAVFLAGRGRSGLAASMFAIRLMHLGLTSHVIGEMTAPALRSEDLVVTVSGSGKTPTTLLNAQAAKEAGAKVACVTAMHNSELSKLADLVIVLPAPNRLSTGKDRGKSVQYGATLFEQSVLILFDSLFLRLRDIRPARDAELDQRHANFD